MKRLELPGTPAEQADMLKTSIVGASVDTRAVALLRFVAVQGPAGDWHAAFGRIDVCRDGDFELGPQHRYQRMLILAQKMPAQSFVSELDAIIGGNGSFTCGGTELALGPPQQWQAEMQTSRGDYATAWPSYYWERALNLRSVALPEGPFASHKDESYFADVLDAIAGVAKFRRFNGWADGRKHTLGLNIWRYEGRFGRVLVRANGELEANVESECLERLAVRGRLTAPEGRQVVASDATSQVVVTPKLRPETIELVLVAEGDEIVDQVDGRWPVVPSAQLSSLGSVEVLADGLMRGGECAGAEYKPYVRLNANDKKWTEVLDTVIAMANAGGGYILFGVDNHGTPRFAHDDREALATKSVTAKHLAAGDEATLVDAARAYGHELRDKVQQYINRSPSLLLHVIWRGNGPVLLVEIEEGIAKPYMDLRNNNLWIRTNATNRRPPEDELVKLFDDRYRSGSAGG